MRVGFVFLSLFRMAFEMRSTFLSSHVYGACIHENDPEASLVVQRSRLHLPIKGCGFSPSQGATIPHASWTKYQNTEQKQCCNKISKDFKNDIRQKNPKKKKKIQYQ